MNLSFDVVLIIFIFMIYADIMIACALLIGKLKRDIKHNDFELQQKSFTNDLLGDSKIKKSLDYTKIYRKMYESILISDKQMDRIKQNIKNNKKEYKYIKKLKSNFMTNRIVAAVRLGSIATEDARLALQTAISREKNLPAKLYMANSLCDIGNELSIECLVDSLINTKLWYRSKVNMLIANYGKGLYDYFPHIINRDDVEIIELIVDFSSVYFSDTLKQYLINLINNFEVDILRYQQNEKYNTKKCCYNCTNCKKMIINDDYICKIKGNNNADYCCLKYRVNLSAKECVADYSRIVYKATEVMAEYYFNDLNNDKYLYHTDTKLNNIAIKALAKENSHANLMKLISLLENETQARASINAISNMIEKNPNFLSVVTDIFLNSTNQKVKNRLSEVLSIRIEYFILKLLSNQKDKATMVVLSILDLGKTSKVITFVNSNKDINLENILVSIIKQAIDKNENIKEDFCKYLDPHIIQKCGLEKCCITITPRDQNDNRKMVHMLYSLLIFSLLVVPLIYFARHYQSVLIQPVWAQLKTYVLEFNYYIVFYSVIINVIYLVLLMISLLEVRKQKKLWKSKSMPFLFKKKILPSISIIAPAYNEEKTIIESVNSLLNLKYPDYELVVVNDGSKDDTLKILIDYFKLIRIDYIFENSLETMPIRAIYTNHSLPKLFVVDKENGGKADSLNTGINVATKEYFCGIDADSLLDEFALLKIASLTLDQGVETPALGGNVFPINGCKVEKGVLSKINIPKNSLARFQTIEYIRAFMAGRLGWARINSLLIISGAFGLFRRERIISVGGYLTTRGRFGQDTMGEDMELVVRVSRLMREMKLKFKINYAFNANCWTEVPEDIKSLKRQRLRWQRGLVEILSFHKKMIFNPKYGRTGFFAMPYFFIFELLGPLFEIQGYLMVAIAFFVGLLNIQLAVLLFVANILFGILISLTSLYISEKESDYFSYKDIFILWFYAIIENFGIRQWLSLWRFTGFIKLLKKPSGEWEKADRKGFAETKSEVTD